MSVIKIENLTFAYPSSFDNIFENVSFQIGYELETRFYWQKWQRKNNFFEYLAR